MDIAEFDGPTDKPVRVFSLRAAWVTQAHLAYLRNSFDLAVLFQGSSLSAESAFIRVLTIYRGQLSLASRKRVQQRNLVHDYVQSEGLDEKAKARVRICLGEFESTMSRSSASPSKYDEHAPDPQESNLNTPTEAAQRCSSWERCISG
jgi:hypothetical protein